MLGLLSLVTLVAMVFWYIRFRKSRQRMYELADKLPGPPELPFIGHLHRFMGDTEDITTTFKELTYLAIHQGGLTKVWLGPLLYCVLTDPVEIEYVLKMNFEKEHLSSSLSREVAPTGIVFAPVPLWRHRRRTLAPAFSLANLNQLVEVFVERSQVAVDQLSDKVDAGEFDIFTLFASYSLWSILHGVRKIQGKCIYASFVIKGFTLLAMGVDKLSSKFLANSSESSFGVAPSRYSNSFDLVLKAIADLMNIIIQRMVARPWLQPSALFRLSPLYKTYRKHLDLINSIIGSLLQDHKSETGREAAKKYEEHKTEHEKVSWKPFLTFMTAKTGEQSYSDPDLRDEVISLGLAGTDTSSVGACFSLLLMAKHEDVQDKVYKELLDVFGESDRPLVKEDLPKLTYLERVIKESLRLYPPVPIIGRESNEEVTLPSGRVLPAGCGIVVGIWSVHRDPKYWGADVEQFQPDRFSSEAPTHPGAYIPFSAGPRNCIGYQYAMISLKVSLTTVLRKYRVGVGSAYSGTQQIPIKFEVMLKAAKGFNITLHLRK